MNLSKQEIEWRKRLGRGRDTLGTLLWDLKFVCHSILVHTAVIVYQKNTTWIVVLGEEVHVSLIFGIPSLQIHMYQSASKTDTFPQRWLSMLSMTFQPYAYAMLMLMSSTS